MITEKAITELVQAHIEGSNVFLVEVAIKAGNAIRIHVDTPEGISIDQCVKISRFLNDRLDRDVEDYSLEVSSPGLGAPLKVKQQYEKNTGRSIEVYMTGGERVEGKLESVHEGHIVLRIHGKEAEVRFDKIKKAKAIISFN
ncbi:MAG: ribosome assembly cofactor RimP [Bacteroidota bacterium]